MRTEIIITRPRLQLLWPPPLYIIAVMMFFLLYCPNVTDLVDEKPSQLHFSSSFNRKKRESSSWKVFLLISMWFPGALYYPSAGL